MSNSQVGLFSRGIRSVRTVPFRKNSSIHTVGLVVEPGHWQEHDPFLLMAHDYMRSGVFDIHPHRGMETVTYMIDGRLNHYDSKYGKGVLEPGDAQWMTAGRGVEHVEDAAPGKLVSLLQLWVNLPASAKMTAPRYQDLRKDEMPLIEENGAHIRVFSGPYNDKATAPTANVAPVTMLEIKLEPGAVVAPQLPASYNGFMYVLEGDGVFGPDGAISGEKGQVLWLEAAPDTAEQSEIRIEANSAMHVMLYAGQPIDEPVVAHGPFVMNTMEEIQQAYFDYRNGNF